LQLYLKISFIASLLITTGIVSAHNAKWMRDGLSPWWTTYITSFISASIFAYMIKANVFSLTYTSAFQTFLFHASWYLTTLFWIGENLSPHRLVGLFLVMLGMVLMSIK
jgi:drug/metabolite transporter (DMT)-like permease